MNFGSPGRCLRGLAVFALSPFALAACDRCGAEVSNRGDAASPPDAAHTSAAGDAAPPLAVPRDAAAEPPRDAGIAGDASRAAAVPPDAGLRACRLAYGPALQPFSGPAALVVTPAELRVVANDGGKPRVFGVPLGAPPPPGARSIAAAVPSSILDAPGPACEIAGRWAYCAAKGAVYRTTLGAADTVQVAKSRERTRISAAAMGPDHAIVATLDTRRTSEGETFQAFVTLDNGRAVRLSDDGVGATSVRLLARGDEVVAAYLDARMAMLPVHARTVSRQGTELAFGSDSVVFLGGPPERGVDFALAAGAGALFALVPMPHHASDFGMAAIALFDPPKVDVPAVWSYYPNGLDPAPIGATTQAADPSGAWVARARPRESAVGSPQVVELGRVDAGGAFTSFGTLGEFPLVTDIAIASDRVGSVWIAYGVASADADGIRRRTWLERRVCP